MFNNPSLLAMLQGGGPGSPMPPGLMAGPIPTQNPQPGFRAPGAVGMPGAPQMPQGNAMDQGAQMMGLAAAMQRMRGAPTGTPVGTPGTPGFLGGLTNPDQAGVNAQAMGAGAPGTPMTAGGGNSFIDFLTGLRTKLFG